MVSLVQGVWPPASLPANLGAFSAAVGRELVAWQGQLAKHLVLPTLAMIPGLSAPDPNLGALALDGFLNESQVPVPAQVVGGGTPPVAASELSDVWLARTRGDQRVLVLKRAGMSPVTRIHGEAFVFSLDISALNRSSGNGFRTRSNIPHTVDWIFADDLFFPKKLTALNLDLDNVLDVGQTGGFSLPLTADFFRYFNHGDVKRILSSQIQGLAIHDC